MKLLIRLTSIVYKGAVGSNWSFVLDFNRGEFTFPFNAEVRSGQPRVFTKLVYFNNTPGKGSLNLPVKLKATERDLRFPESGSNSTTFNIDLRTDQPQTFRIGVDVKEDRGPKVKTKATGHLDFEFLATVAGDDEQCGGAGDVEFEVLDKKDSATAKDFAYAEKEYPDLNIYGATVVDPKSEIFRCVYRKNDEWRVSVLYAGVQIRWGTNPKRYRNIVFPGSGSASNVSCATVDEMLKDVDYHIRERLKNVKPVKAGAKIIGGLFVPAPGKGKKPRWHVREIIEAHERVHVKEYGDILKKSWPSFQERINNYIVGRVDTMTRAQANKAAGAFLDVIGEELTDCILTAGEDGPSRVEIDLLKDILRQLISFKDVECGPIFNSKVVSPKTATKKTSVKKRAGAKKKKRK